MPSEDDRHEVEILPDDLSADALRGVVEEFVTRDGTDYGAVERSVAEKVAEVLGQLRSGQARLVFDLETQTANIVPARDLRQGRG